MTFCLFALVSKVQWHTGSQITHREGFKAKVFSTFSNHARAPTTTSLTLYLSTGPGGIALLFLKQSIKHVLICHIQFKGGCGVCDFRIYFFIVFMVVWFALFALCYIRKLLSCIKEILFEWFLPAWTPPLWLNSWPPNFWYEQSGFSLLDRMVLSRCCCLKEDVVLVF